MKAKDVSYMIFSVIGLWWPAVSTSTAECLPEGDSLLADSG